MINKHEARLTGNARSIRDKGLNYSESFELGAGRPLLSMRLLVRGLLGNFCEKTARFQTLKSTAANRASMSRKYLSKLRLRTSPHVLILAALELGLSDLR